MEDTLKIIKVKQKCSNETMEIKAVYLENNEVTAIHKQTKRLLTENSGEFQFTHVSKD